MHDIATKMSTYLKQAVLSPLFSLLNLLGGVLYPFFREKLIAAVTDFCDGSLRSGCVGFFLSQIWLDVFVIEFF